MALDFITEDIKTELGLDDDKLAKLEPVFTGYIAEQKKSWDGVANQNAEKIIDGALSKIAEATKVQRLDGEKAADYITRAGSEAVKGQKEEVSRLKSDYEEKLKNFKGDDAAKAELQTAKEKLDEAQKQLAELDKYKQTAEKYEPLEQKYNQIKNIATFQAVKPALPDGVNKWEFDAKWKAFEDAVNKDWDVELVEREPIAISKENPHLQKKLTDLLSADKDLSELLQGRQQTGTGAKAKGQITVADVPFTLPENPSSEDVSKAINDYLDKQGIAKLSPERTGKFAELHAKVKAGINK